MSRPPLKNQVALPLLLAAVFWLALYVVGSLTPAPPPNPTDQQSVSQMAGSVAQLFISIALWMSVALVAVRALNSLVFFVFNKRRGYAAPSLMRDIFSLVLYITALALILKFHFKDLSFGALLSGSALLGVILGLALQDTLGNLFAGISLHADKPFQVGDVITVGRNTGVLMASTWRAVKIKTFSNHIVLVSNSVIAKESIEVCPQNGSNARVVTFGAAYTDSPVKVIHVVREAVRECDNVIRYMTPNVRIRNLGDSAVEYEVKYWLIDYSRYNDTDALIRQRIWYAFRRNGLTFAFPTRTLYMEQTPGRDGEGRDAETLAELLSAMDIFSPLTAKELNALASNARGRVFAPGETIIRAGDSGSSMFVVSRGSVDVRVDSNGTSRVVKRLTEGDFFGEMGLFTGEPRTANVIAADETEVLEIGHDAMKGLFENNPDLVEALSHTINERRAGLAARSDAPASEQETPAGLLSRIKHFFRLD
ncbi:MAG TPA: mechanosensitive ion channel family protein [Pyrinomonadaceae bacterium]|jgi:small-conductance mechanosensitive channel|nr:mechanosensitive ion channel family protein [Pyrinomonadaceae bacterium]